MLFVPPTSDEERRRVDPITLEIMHNFMRSVTDEMFIALMKSAYSSNIKERHDHSATLMDDRGYLVAQAEQSLPIHLGSIKGMMDAILKKYPPEKIRPGDIFIGNDPYVAGGSHLPDINMAMPVFVDEEIVAWVCNIAHHADIGGMAPGSMAGGMTEIYQEGLRLPCVKLFSQGNLQGDILDIFLLNARLPDERRGDLNAQIAACMLGERRVKEMVSLYARVQVADAFAEVIRRTGDRLRDAIGALPDGEFVFEDFLDDDGAGTSDVAIKLRLTIAGRNATFDFTGSSAQTAGNINCPLIATESAVYFAVKALLDPEVPNNRGIFDAIDIVAPEGTVLNCTFPASVAARAHVCQRIVDVVFGAMADALPQRVTGAANGANTTAVFSGVDPRNGRPYIYFETLGGGAGARASKDGRDGIQVHITNTSNLPIEAIELEYPLVVEAYQLVEDSGGAGRWRGGLSLRRKIRPLPHRALFSGHSERFRYAPWGIFGGEPGRSGEFTLLCADGTRRALTSKPSGVSFAPGEAIEIVTPGAGGYGEPRSRDAESIRDDLASGKFTRAFLSDHYPQFAAGSQSPDEI